MFTDEILLTIFTPTYNRRAALHRLHASLCKQTDLRFEWLIVDDGSTDSSKDSILQWQSTSPFPIRYLWQENSGKHVAHNLGARKARGYLFICVDSDDWLEAGAVETILSDAAALDAEEGLLYPKQFAQQIILDTWFPEGIESIELSDMRIKYGLVVETAIVFKTSILLRHPFPVIPGEKYMPEGSAYYDFRDPELFHIFYTPFYRCEYLEKGLTNNIWLNWLNNPKGTRIALGKRYAKAQSSTGLRALRERIAAVVGIQSLRMALGKRRAIEPLGSVFERTLCMTLSLMLARKRYGGISDAGR